MDYSKSGYVYILQMEGHAYYKIGRTVNVDRRVSQIKPQMPGRLILLFAHRAMDAWRMEGVLHDNFKHRRLNGEWFNLEPIDIVEIKYAMLADQAVVLYRRLLQTIASGYGEVDHVRFSHALYKASLRMQRRLTNYTNVSWDRTQRCGDEYIDQVLDAEIVG